MTVRRTTQPVALRPATTEPVVKGGTSSSHTKRATVTTSAPAQLEGPAPKQLVTLDPEQPTSRDDVYLRGQGPGWVDPTAAHADGAARISTYTGPLFRDDPSASDVQQGQLGDCYVAAGLASIAQVNPQAIRELIKPGPDGSAIVTFHQRDLVTGEFHPVVIHVDTELYESWYGGPLYGHAPGNRASMELWFPLVEKAYATWRGGYEEVGKGGTQNQLFEAVLGRPAGWLAINEFSDSTAVWNTIQATERAGLPIGAATHSVDDGRYANTGVHANHGYSILKTEETQGQRYVWLRNPWGSGEPRNNGADDGVFRLKFEDFQKLFGQLQFTLL